MRLATTIAGLALVLATSASAESRDASGFDAISASAGVPVEVIVGPTFRVDVTGRDAARIETRVEGDTLIIRPRGTWHWGRRDAEVQVTMPSVRELEASSGARIEAGQIDGGEIDLGASSGAQVRVAGSCAAVNADASSGANIDARNLRCGAGVVDVSSGAQVNVHVSGRLDVEASSGGEVRAAGSPELGNISLSSGGSLRRIEN